MPILRAMEALKVFAHARAGFNPYPAHRLDMYTSGVVIVAKKKVTVVRLHEMFRQVLKDPAHGEFHLLGPGKASCYWLRHNIHRNIIDLVAGAGTPAVCRDKNIQKHYLALVTGSLVPEQQQVDAPIARHPHVK